MKSVPTFQLSLRQCSKRAGSTALFPLLLMGWRPARPTDMKALVMHATGSSPVRISPHVTVPDHMSLDVTTCHSFGNNTTIDPTPSCIATFRSRRAIVAGRKKGDYTITRRRSGPSAAPPFAVALRGDEAPFAGAERPPVAAIVQLR